MFLQFDMLEGQTQSSENFCSSGPTHKLNVPTEPLPWGIEREYGHNSFLKDVSASNLRLGRTHSNSNPTVSQVSLLHFSRSQRLSLDVTQHLMSKYCDCCCRVILIPSKDVAVLRHITGLIVHEAIYNRA